MEKQKLLIRYFYFALVILCSCNDREAIDIDSLTFSFLKSSSQVKIEYENKLILVDSLTYPEDYEMKNYTDLVDWYNKKNDYTFCDIFSEFSSNNTYRKRTASIKDYEIYNKLINHFHLKIDSINVVKKIILKSQFLSTYSKSIEINSSNFDSIYLSQKTETEKIRLYNLKLLETQKSNTSFDIENFRSHILSVNCLLDYQMETLKELKNNFDSDSSFYIISNASNYNFLVFEFTYEVGFDNIIKLNNLRLLNPIKLSQSLLFKL